MDLVDTAKSILRTVAPAIGTAIAGPFGGMAAKAVSELLLGKPDGTPEELSQAIQNATPEQLVELKKIDAEFKVSMKKLDIDINRISYEDRNSARQREVALRDNVPALLAIVTLVSFFAYIGMVTFLPTSPVADKTFISVAVGWLGGTASTVIAYYFGDSASASKMLDKGET
jgi:uncharacterized membrane protein (DUF485 family)